MQHSETEAGSGVGRSDDAGAGVDLSGVVVGDWAMTRKYGACKLDTALGEAFTYPLLWKLSETVKFSTTRSGRMVHYAIKNSYDIIRLLPAAAGPSGEVGT